MTKIKTKLRDMAVLSPRYWWVLALLLGTLAQPLHASIILEGSIEDYDTGESLPYAQIVVSGRGMGTVSNGDGAFVLNLPEALYFDTIVFRYVGYATQRMVLSSLQAPLVIRLKPKTVSLQTVLIRADEADDLLVRAIQRVPENHDARPLRQTGFYRLVSQEADTVIQLSEAVFDVFQPGMDAATKPLGKPQFRLRRNRGERDASPFKGQGKVMFGMRPQGVLAYDFVRDIQASDIFGRKGRKRHTWTLEGLDYRADRPVWRVAFDQKPGQKRALYRGVVYLDTATLAFAGLDAALSPRGMRYHKTGTLTERLLMEALALTITTTYDSIHINYQPVRGHWYLADMHLIDKNTIRDDRVPYTVRVASTVRYVSTQLDTAAAPFPSEDVLGRSTFIENVDSPDDPGFWLGWNVVPWERSFLVEAERIRARNALLEEAESE